MGAACPVEEAGVDGLVGDCREGCGLALAGGRVPVCRVADGLAGVEVPLPDPDPPQPATSNDMVTITTGSTASGALRTGIRLGFLGLSTRTSWPGPRRARIGRRGHLGRRSGQSFPDVGSSCVRWSM